MKALVFNVRLNSLYSIRLPYSWQSALTYPILPPSAVIGILANAFQRFNNNKHPLEYLKKIEEEVIWAGSKLLSPCIIKSYTLSAITKFGGKIGEKFTNVLGRQFAYAKNLQILTIFKNTIPQTLIEALYSTPLTAGDSESPLSIENEIRVLKVEYLEDKINQSIEVTTEYPVPFVKEWEITNGSIYLLHERCLKREKFFPLIAYVLPLKETNGIIYPTIISIKCPNSWIKYEIEDIGIILFKKNKNI